MWCEFSTGSGIFSAVPFAFCPLASCGFTDETIPEVVDESKHGFKNLVVCSNVIMVSTHIVAQLADSSGNLLIGASLPNERRKIADHDEFCWRESAAFNRLREFGIQHEGYELGKGLQDVFFDFIFDSGLRIQPLFQAGNGRHDLRWCLGNQKCNGSDALEISSPRRLDSESFCELLVVNHEPPRLSDYVGEGPVDSLKAF